MGKKADGGQAMQDRGVIRIILLDAEAQARSARTEYECALAEKGCSVGKIDFTLHRANERMRAYRRIAAICRQYGIDAKNL